MNLIGTAIPRRTQTYAGGYRKRRRMEESDLRKYLELKLILEAIRRNQSQYSKVYINLSIEETKERIHLLRIKSTMSNAVTLIIGEKSESRKSHRSTQRT